MHCVFLRFGESGRLGKVRESACGGVATRVSSVSIQGHRDAMSGPSRSTLAIVRLPTPYGPRHFSVCGYPGMCCSTLAWW